MPTSPRPGDQALRLQGAVRVGVGLAPDRRIGPFEIAVDETRGTVEVSWAGVDLAVRTIVTDSISAAVNATHRERVGPDWAHFAIQAEVATRLELNPDHVAEIIIEALDDRTLAAIWRCWAILHLDEIDGDLSR